jgi:hypothetical protein
MWKTNEIYYLCVIHGITARKILADILNRKGICTLFSLIIIIIIINSLFIEGYTVS